MDAFSRQALAERAWAVRNTAAEKVRRLLDIKLSNQATVRDGAMKDETLKRLNVTEAEANAHRLR